MQNQEHQAYIEANRRAWNQVAPLHAAVNQERLLQSFRQPDFSVLDEYETAKLHAIGVAGKSVAQLGCNNGRELLSIKNMGAGRCVGFDISDEFIRQAQALNAAAGHDCEFVATSVYDIPATYDEQFDLIFISIGVLSWMPDLDAFFAVVARLLRAGGQLMIYEMHPFTTMLNVPDATDTPLQIELSYFKRDAHRETDGLDYYTRQQYDALPNYWFTQTLSTLLNGCTRNGIAISSFDEYAHDISSIFGHLEPLQMIPLSYILVGQKGEQDIATDTASL